MHSKSDNANKKSAISRRKFLGLGGTMIAGGSLSMCSVKTDRVESPAAEVQPGIKKHYTLGRTGFRISDISMGCGSIKESSVVRYAYDKGINYFDTAESYGNGDSERKIGEALPFMDRKRIFITTKLHFEENDTEETLLDRFGKCRERLKTDYVDALMMHSVTDINLLSHAGFHGAVGKLKAEGRLKYAGISSHGPRGQEGDSMEKVLCAAAEDGRFDLMLLVYSFMNKEEGEKILAACKKNNVGATGMKTTPGVLKVPAFDPDNPSEEHAGYIKRMMERGSTREEADERIRQWVARQEENRVKTGPFMEKHGLKTEEQLWTTSLQWVLNNPQMHSICVSLPDFEQVDRAVSLSGTALSSEQNAFLHLFDHTFTDRYCRHGCNACVSSCPHGLPVSTIMRYAYYYECQGREKHAIEKYAALQGRDASPCGACRAPCEGACPHGVQIQANLLHAHTLLTLA
jgi:predicted aldo/keto reductase-like oxidoreductase